MQITDIERRQEAPALNKYVVVRQRRKSVERDFRLISQNGLDVRLEIVKRQTKRSDGRDLKYRFVNGQYYPEPTRYGYRFTGLPVRTLNLNEMRELCANLMSILQTERE